MGKTEACAKQKIALFPNCCDCGIAALIDLKALSNNFQLLDRFACLALTLAMHRLLGFTLAITHQHTRTTLADFVCYCFNVH